MQKGTSTKTGSGALAAGYTDKDGVAAYLSICRRQVDNLMLAGLPHFKPSARIVRFRLPDIDEWIGRTRRSVVRPMARGGAR